MKRNTIILLSIGVFLLIWLVVILIAQKPPSKINISKTLVDQAQIKLSQGDLLGAQKLYMQAIKGIENTKYLEDVRVKTEDLNIKILFSSLIDECSVQYSVKPRDTLTKIAKEFQTTVALIKRANGLESDLIKPKQKLKVNNCKFSIVVDKSQNILFLKRNDSVIKTYVVSTGKDNSTPVGKFKITNEKLINPTWFKTGAVVLPDSPENILGTRWMGLDIKGYGIHGNRNINEIGKQVTQGCVRMRNEDVEELYDIVPPGTEVIIVD